MSDPHTISTLGTGPLHGAMLAHVNLDACFLHDVTNSPNSAVSKDHALMPSGQVRTLCVES